MDALVIKNVGSRYTLLCADGAEREAVAKGNLRLKGIRTTNPVAVGDRVRIEVREEGDSYLSKIEARRNYVIRRASNLSKEAHILGANLDCALLLCTVARPETSTTFIDRFLATAEAYRIPVEIVFNKMDDLDEFERELLNYLMEIYLDIGYPVYAISAQTGIGLKELKERMVGRVTLLSGHSGVGKSTLINALVPEANLRTAPINELYLTGVHTTTYSSMIPLGKPAITPDSISDSDGYLIDTPGVKGFGTIEMDLTNASHFFPEIFRESAHCRFSNCTHIHEPDCAVLAAVDREDIAPSRYNSYLSILDDEEEEKYRPEY